MSTSLMGFDLQEDTNMRGNFWDEEDFGGWARWYTEKRVKVL